MPVITAQAPTFEVILCADHLAVTTQTDLHLTKLFQNGARNYMFGIGRTQYPLFEQWRTGKSAFSEHIANIRYVQGDEYLGLSKNDPRRLLNSMNSRLGIIGQNQTTGFAPNQITAFNNDMPSVEAVSCFEKALVNIGGIDVVATGVGADGHVFFNPPGTSLNSRTRPITLWDAVKSQNAQLLSGDGQEPQSAITVGLGTISEAKTHIIMASGEGKAQALAALFRGKVDPQWPITYLHGFKQPNCKRVKIIADEAAMSLV